MKKKIALLLLTLLCAAAVAMAACTPEAEPTVPSTGTQPSQSESSCQTEPSASAPETTVSTAPPPTSTQHTHQYENWITIKQQTCVSKELSTGTCSCGQTYTVVVKESTGIHTYDEMGDCTGCGRHVSLGLSYVLTEDEAGYIVVGPGECLEADLVIDSVYDQKPVVGIAENAFAACDFIQSVTLPDTLSFIGDSAFTGCKGLRQIAIGDSVTDLGMGIFDGCTSLTAVSLPKHLETVPEGMFAGSGLTEIYLPNSVSAIGKFAFFDCGRLETIHFAGTVQDWEAMTFGENWIVENQMPVILCVDGTVENDTPEPDTEQG